MSHVTETTADRIWGAIGLVVKVLFVLGILAAIFAVWVVWQISQAFPQIHPVPAPVAWVTRDVELSAAEPVVRGELVLTATRVPTESLRIGVNAGAPTAEPMASPGAILAGPTVQIATDAALNESVCFAPCELQVRPAWACDPGDCRMVVGFTLALSLDAAESFGPVTIGVAGGITTASLEDELPPGIQATIELRGEIAPGAT